MPAAITAHHGGQHHGYYGKYNGRNFGYGNYYGRYYGGYRYPYRYGSYYGSYYPWLSYSPFGWGWGIGLGSPLLYGGGWPYYGYGGWGGYGYGSYGYPVTGTYLYANAAVPTVTVQSPAVQAPAAQAPAANQAPALPADQAERADRYVAAGEQSFRAGKYEDALRDWQHAMVDDPNNGGVVLLMSQALFAVGQWDAAANTLQGAMQMLPESEWGTVLKNYKELYPDVAVYTKQIRTAEEARDAAPDDPALRFLLGYHFGYLNYPKHAVQELDKALDIEPRDAGSEKLRSIFAQQAGLPAPGGPAHRRPKAAHEPAHRATTRRAAACRHRRVTVAAAHRVCTQCPELEVRFMGNPYSGH